MGSRERRLEDEVAGWPHVSVHPHRFLAREFRFGKAEIGHIHFWGDIDIPFTRDLRDALIEDRLAERHRFVPDSGWTTFRMRTDADSNTALMLMRMSYLRYALKAVPDPRDLFDRECARLGLRDKYVAALQRFIRIEATP
jgi:hypothetical protein